MLGIEKRGQKAGGLGARLQLDLTSPNARNPVREAETLLCVLPVQLAGINGCMALEGRYRIKIKPYRKLLRPVPLDLAKAEGCQRVLDAAKRVMGTHADVLAALARK